MFAIWRSIKQERISVSHKVCDKAYWLVNRKKGPLFIWACGLTSQRLVILLISRADVQEDILKQYIQATSMCPLEYRSNFIDLYTTVKCHCSQVRSKHQSKRLYSMVTSSPIEYSPAYSMTHPAHWHPIYHHNGRSCTILSKQNGPPDFFSTVQVALKPLTQTWTRYIRIRETKPSP